MSAKLLGKTVLKQIVLCLLAIPTIFASVSTQAQELPALFAVSGVASNDVLNVRAEPSGSAQIVGSLAPQDTGVEVVDIDASGKWGRVNIGEASGWAALRYLNHTPANPDYALTPELRCFGTEPFWSLDIRQGHTARFATPSDQGQVLLAGLLQTSQNRRDSFLLGLGAEHTAVVSRQACSDGMSDRAFGLSISLITPDNGRSLYSGCCTLVP